MHPLWELETKTKQSVILSQKVALLNEGTRSTIAYHFCPIADEESYDQWITLRFATLDELTKATDPKGRRLAHREVILQVSSWDAKAHNVNDN
jgi:hypothetical protein